ncbi:MAG TPA: HEPN domain-containing protein [Spirochaetota bacterium]|nr:HEPN domain-containing protein [Spirochaetota bacterium]HNT12139.1 HEPN domain-containing protein [Spirochaetota bacterium]HNV47675.1 HEPN domain-containing protein [Spirochaetota bacterium]HPU88674.1 HEPN domain-containing protein [Spirochaetota bacterium]
MTGEIQQLLQKARQSLDAATLLLHDRYTDFSAARSYYAMFYALEALLLSRNQSYSKHSAVIAAFGKDFVKTGLFDDRYHRHVLEAFEIRNIGDYGIINSVNAAKADEMIHKAHELIDAIEAFLRNAHCEER